MRARRVAAALSAAAAPAERRGCRWVLRRPDGGVPAVARCHPSSDELLKEKVATLEASLRRHELRAATGRRGARVTKEHTDAGGLSMWHVGDEPDCRGIWSCTSVGGTEIDRRWPRKINELMPVVRRRSSRRFWGGRSSTCGS